MSRADMDLHLSDASARFPELVTVRRSRAAAIAKALAMVAVIATAIAVTIVVRSIGGDRDGWKATAEAAERDNAELRARLDAQATQIEQQTDELACRSEAAAVQSAAAGELSIEIGATAEAALRIAAGEPLDENLTTIATRLHNAAQDLRESTQARDEAFDTCSEGG